MLHDTFSHSCDILTTLGAFNPKVQFGKQKIFNQKSVFHPPLPEPPPKKAQKTPTKPKSEPSPLLSPACNDCTHKGLSQKLASWNHHLSTMKVEDRSRCEDSPVFLYHTVKPPGSKVVMEQPEIKPA